MTDNQIPNPIYPENRALISVSEAASALRSSRSTIYYWIRKGILPVVNVYGRSMIDPTIIPDFRERIKGRNALRGNAP
ncbi:helix-turn-helix domain-containing protein [Komagataeibacter xylinus]